MTHDTRPPRPRSVTHALWLLYASVALGAIRSLLEWPALSSEEYAPGLIDFVIVVVPVLFLTFMIGQGRNWARIAYLVITLLGLPLFILFGAPSLLQEPVSGAIALGQLTMQLLALILLFRRTGATWFAAVKHARAGSSPVAQQAGQ